MASAIRIDLKGPPVPNGDYFKMAWTPLQGGCEAQRKSGLLALRAFAMGG
jgi:hypothetical protein